VQIGGVAMFVPQALMPPLWGGRAGTEAPQQGGWHPALTQTRLSSLRKQGSTHPSPCASGNMDPSFRWGDTGVGERTVNRR